MSQELVGDVGSPEPHQPFSGAAVAVTEHDEDLIIASLKALAPSIAAITGRDCEVVVHDLREPERSIVTLVNGHVSGRKLGGPLIGGPMNDVALGVLSRRKNPDPRMLSYVTKTGDGRSLKSTTTLYYNANGAPFAGLCLNHDLSTPLAAARWLESVVGEVPVPAPAPDSGSGSPDFNLVLDQLIEECVGQEPGPAKDLDRDARLRIIHQLEARGAFLMRGAVVRVAAVLGVSKFTVYGYLDEVKAS